MKKAFILILFVAGILTSASAQVMHGPVAGVNFANVAGDDAKDNSMITGFHAGWFVNFRLAEKITLQPQATFSVKGTDFDLGDKTLPLKFYYIEVPVLARYHFGNGLHFDLGPYAAFLMSATLDGNSEFNNEKISDGYKSTDFGGVAGVGYELSNGLGFLLSYHLGLSNIADYEDGDLTNNSIGLSVSYTFGAKE
ncbi:MAG TPA: porin family protein [Bacteroidia bacterium]|nr:porin family protein [Bacteroidia bacterium]